MATRLNSVQNVLDTLKRVQTGASQAFGEGREDHRQAARRAREERGQEIEGTKIGQMMSSNRSATLLRELMGMAKKDDIKAREQMGLGLSEDRATAIGQVLGTIGGDIVQDRGRELWWLLNAPQAVGNVAQEVALKRAAPEVYGTHEVMLNGRPVSSKKQAVIAGIADADGNTKAGISKKGSTYRERNYAPGYVDALAIPAGIAINSGIGLLNPFGGQEGYKAVLESEEDPSKTNNVLGEIAAKYILGKTGGLLPWDEFKQVRPDVSKDEYMRYKAFKFDNDGDLNPFDDGQAVVPTGVLKYTNEGIHGPAVQFLGRSLPLATGILPTVAAIAGTAAGARRGARTGNAIRGGMIGGMSSLAAGSLTGNLIEGERRRRNQEENESGYN